MIPRFNPIMAAWVRSLAPSLERILRTWPLTGLRRQCQSSDAISLLALPSAISRKTRVSAGQSESSASMLGELEGHLGRHGSLARVDGANGLDKFPGADCP